jgi:long-chain acyl-CoA synthetase
MKISEDLNIDQVCIVGSGMPQPIALVVLSTIGRDNLDIQNSLEKTRLKVNSILEKHELIHNFVVVTEVWSVENNLLTPSMKIKRNSLEKLYGEHYASWYENDSIIIL